MIRGGTNRRSDAAYEDRTLRPRVCGANMTIPTMVTCICLVAGCASLAATDSSTASVALKVANADSSGASVGTVRFEDSRFGLLILPNLKNLQPGPHAAHIHANPDCSAGTDGSVAGAAGDHYDPQKTGVHAGPYGNGHLGDLPNLIVEADGTARLSTLAPRLTASDIAGRSLMVHTGADRYDAHAAHDHGKGGARMYCGVIN